MSAFHRAAFHLHQLLKKDGDINSEQVLISLQKLYVSLQEPDLVLGVAAVRKTDMSLDEMIQLHQATGNYTDALSCYKLFTTDPYGHVECFLRAGQPHTALALGATFSKLDDQTEKGIAPLQVGILTCKISNTNE